MAFSQNVTKLAAAVVAVVALVAIIDGAPVIVGAAASVSHGDSITQSSSGPSAPDGGPRQERLLNAAELA